MIRHSSREYGYGLDVYIRQDDDFEYEKARWQSMSSTFIRLAESSRAP